MNAYLRIKHGGTSVEVVPYLGSEGGFFSHMRQELGDAVVEPVYMGRHPTAGECYMLVDEDGYAKYGHDSANVNRIATAIYNPPGKAPPHHILGDVAICRGRVDENSEEFLFAPMSIEDAQAVAHDLEECGVLIRAESMTLPDVLPEPSFRVESFESTEEMVRFLAGEGNPADWSRKPLASRKAT